MLRSPRIRAKWIFFGLAAALVAFGGLRLPGQGVVKKTEVKIEVLGPRGVMPPGGMADPKKPVVQQFSAVKLIENSIYRQYVNVARDSIKDQAWGDAVTALQKILDT